MIIGPLDTNDKVLIIAEIGNNHEGDYATAERLIKAAAKAGVDAVKFQTFRTEHYVSSSNQKRFAKLKSFELTFDEFKKLARCASEHDLVFLSTPFDLKSAEFLNSIVPAFKISSSDNTFEPLLRQIASYGKPIILSTGLACEGEIQQTIQLIADLWKGNSMREYLALLHCVARYPVPDGDANLSRIKKLETVFGTTVGYSDHTLGITAAPLAVACGARIVEKHFTLNKNYSDFHDHQLSADPEEMAILVSEIRKTETLIGDKGLAPGREELKSVMLLRRSVVAVRDLASGSQLAEEDLTWVRPGGGLPPGKEELLIGRILRSDVNKGDKIFPDMLEGEL